MRAETLNNVEAIRKSLNLLGQRMDFETAAHRLEEFDALIEAPDLWNNPAKAQKLMRERQGLLDALSTYKLISSGLNDNVELIELGEAEGDEEIIGEAHELRVAFRDRAPGNRCRAVRPRAFGRQRDLQPRPVRHMHGELDRVVLDDSLHRNARGRRAFSSALVPKVSAALWEPAGLAKLHFGGPRRGTR